MLNLFNFVSKTNKSKKNKNTNLNSINLFLHKEKKTSKHFPSSTREWNNSIYVYNKNSLNLIPSTTNLTTKIIKSYFNLYNKRLELKMRTKRLLLRLRKLSSNRLYVSNGSFKHTNNKVYINLYVFNRQKINHLLTLKKWFLKTIFNVSTFSHIQSNSIIERVRSINKKGIENLISFNKNKYLLIKTLNFIKKNDKYNINTFKSITKYTENFYKKLINKSMKKIRMYFYYKQLIYLNRSKLNYTYLQSLKKHLENIYNKNVEFNIINLKRFYLNSDILSESIALKLAKNRRKLIKYLNNLKNKINIRKKHFLYETTIYKNLFDEKQNTNIKTNFSNVKKDNLELQNHVINNLKYRHITGFRLEAKGRLTKRFTASRSMSKLRYKGNLLNIDSSYRGLSSIILKGNLKSNTQFTKVKSKSRIGSFGIKGWVSGN